MASSLNTALLSCVVLLSLLPALDCHSLKLKPEAMVQFGGYGGDTGYAQNCGTVPFNISWTPKDLHPSKTVSIHVDYTFPHDFDGGFVNASLYFHGDPEPFIGYADKVTCDDVKPYFPLCPVKKGFRINIGRTIYDLHKLSTFPGSYDVKAQLFNSKQQEMLCLNATITVVPNRDF